jgi:hypothetical protein
MCDTVLSQHVPCYTEETNEKISFDIAGLRTKNRTQAIWDTNRK